MSKGAIICKRIVIHNKQRESGQSGQSTVELAVVLPVLIVVAVIAVNAGTFISQCAEFDRLFRNSVCVYATSPASGQELSNTVALVKSEVNNQFKSDFIECDVSVATDAFDHCTFTGKMLFSPTLFGMGIKSEIFGVQLPKLEHHVSLTVDVYKPGIFL